MDNLPSGERYLYDLFSLIEEGGRTMGVEYPFGLLKRRTTCDQHEMNYFLHHQKEIYT